MKTEAYKSLPSETDEYYAFRNSVINNHRFFYNYNDEKLLQIIKNHSEEMVESIDKDQTLYRARIIPDQRSKKGHKNSDPNFQALSEKEISAPPPESAKAGRLNPEHISYLYVADSAYCAMSETRPEIGSHVAVGECHVRKEIKCVSFINLPGMYFPKDHEEKTLIYLNHVFGKAVLNPIEYLPMQVIAEFIRSLKYDGVAYSSSQTGGGMNYLLFDPEICKFTSTVEYQVCSIKYKGYDVSSNKCLEFPKW